MMKVLRCCAWAEQPEFFGNWEITKHVPASEVSAVSYEEVDVYSGTSMSYATQKATFGKEYCEKPFIL